MSQALQLQHLVQTVLGLPDSLQPLQRTDLVRDDFGLHKMIVVATKSGKVMYINVCVQMKWSFLL